MKILNDLSTSDILDKSVTVNIKDIWEEIDKIVQFNDGKLSFLTKKWEIWILRSNGTYMLKPIKVKWILRYLDINICDDWSFFSEDSNKDWFFADQFNNYWFIKEIKDNWIFLCKRRNEQWNIVEEKICQIPEWVFVRTRLSLNANIRMVSNDYFFAVSRDTVNNHMAAFNMKWEIIFSSFSEFIINLIEHNNVKNYINKSSPLISENLSIDSDWKHIAIFDNSTKIIFMVPLDSLLADVYNIDNKLLKINWEYRSITKDLEEYLNKWNNPNKKPRLKAMSDIEWLYTKCPVIDNKIKIKGKLFNKKLLK